MNDKNRLEGFDGAIDFLHRVLNEKSLFVLEVLSSREKISARELEEMFFERFGRVGSGFTQNLRVFGFYLFVRSRLSEENASFREHLSNERLRRFREIVFRALEETDKLLKEGKENG